MIDLVKQFFSKTSKNGLDKSDKNTSHDIRVATCALLLEMAHIDGEFTKSERDKIISALTTNFQLSEQYANELIRKAEEELKRSIDLWQFTNLINHNYTIEEKIQIIEMVWKIAYSDEKLDKHEDYLIHKLANLLRLTHKQLIDAKLRVLDGSIG